MSRHARYRHADSRRVRPAAPADGPRPIGTAAPGSPPIAREPVAPAPSPREVSAAETLLPAVVAPEPPPVAPMAMAAMHVPTASAPVPGDDAGPTLVAGCTPAQLRRFIKSRAYLPVHEIRRRFGIETADDDVTGFDVGSARIYVGLPLREGRILGDLVRAGEVGYELQLDPEAPIVIGVYPMRPVTRQ